MSYALGPVPPIGAEMSWSNHGTWWNKAGSSSQIRATAPARSVNESAVRQRVNRQAASRASDRNASSTARSTLVPPVNDTSPTHRAINEPVFAGVVRYVP